MLGLSYLEAGAYQWHRVRRRSSHLLLVPGLFAIPSKIDHDQLTEVQVCLSYLLLLAGDHSYRE